MRPQGFGKLEKIYLIGTRYRDLPVCSLVPQPLRYRVPHSIKRNYFIFIGMSLAPRKYPYFEAAVGLARGHMILRAMPAVV
jgi:hypothetical protein